MYKDYENHSSFKNYESNLRFLQKPQFYLESLLLLLQPMPFYNSEFEVTGIDINNRTRLISTKYTISHVLLALMFLRIFFLFRAFFNLTPYFDSYSRRLW